jgi:hypothetical protein
MVCPVAPLSYLDFSAYNSTPIAAGVKRKMRRKYSPGAACTDAGNFKVIISNSRSAG